MAVINGDDTDETLKGATGEDNIVNGNGGDDRLNGAGTVIEGASDGFVDTLDGGAGNDTLSGYYGDRLLGGPGVDFLSANPAGGVTDGPFFMDGGTGADSFNWNFTGPNGALGSVVIVDNPGDKVLPSAPGSGAEIRSTVTVDLKTVVGPGNDYAEDYNDHLTLLGSADLDATGNGADNILKGNSGDNEIDGEEGDDTLEGGLGDDTLDGGADTDTAVVGVSRAQATVTFDGDVVVIESSQGTDRYSNFESFQFTDQTIAAGDLTEDTNTAPVATDDSASTEFETSALIDVLGNDTDADGDTLSIDGIAFPASNGTAAIESGQIRYTPNTGFSGTDTFTYGIVDGEGGTDTATVTVTVNEAPNQAPVAVDDSASTAFDSIADIFVTGNDSDPDGDSIAVSAVGTGDDGPSNGTATIISNTTIRYTPNAGFSGTDTFTYTLTDGELTDTATVTVTVTAAENAAPVGVNDSASTSQGTAVRIDVLSNDVDPNGDTLFIVGDDGVPVSTANGTFTPNLGQILYTPNAGFSGTDTFTYTLTDGELTDTATVTVTVSGPDNTAPTAADDSASTALETSVLIDVLSNDTDADGDTLSIDGIAFPASNGTTAIEGGQIRYTPNTGFTGTDSFTYGIADGNGGSDTATVTVTVGSDVEPIPPGRDFFFSREMVDALPSFASDDFTSVSKFFNINALFGLDDDDTRFDEYESSVDHIFKGAAFITGDTIELIEDIGYSGLNLVKFSYSNGVDTEFSRIAILDWDTSNPVASPLDAGFSAGVSQAFSLGGITTQTDDTGGDFLSFLGIDFDGDEEQARLDREGVELPDFSINGMTIPELANGDLIDVLTAAVNDEGFLTFDLEIGGEMVYAIDLDQDVDSIDAVPNDTSSFLYRVRDPEGRSSTGVFSIEVGTDETPNATPEARADLVGTFGGFLVGVNVRNNDTDADGDALTIDMIPTAPQNGEAVILGNRILYTPDQGFAGVDSFVYAVRDGNGGLAVAEARVIVSDANCAQIGGTGAGDALTNSAANECFSGLEGRDTVIFSGAGSDVERAFVTGSTVFSGAQGVDRLDSIERAQFDDGAYIFDATGPDVGYIYRTYSAAFARTPDEGGFVFWNDTINTGAFSREGVAQFFVDSAEFAEKFGADPTDEAFIDALFNNVLLRSPDEAGRQFWLDAFETGLFDRAAMLVFFAESPENVARNEENLDVGVWVV